MTIYHVTDATVVYVEALGRDVTLRPGEALDDQFPDDDAVIKEYAKRGIVRAANTTKRAS